jgi:hypothetical protein
MTMRVAELWRYPVKSLAGEQLEIAEISAAGIPGDRVVQVYSAGGRIVAARTSPQLPRGSRLSEVIAEDRTPTRHEW